MENLAGATLQPFLLSPPHPSTTNLFFCVCLPVPSMSYKWNHTVCGLLLLASFTYHVFRVHPYYRMYEYSFFLLPDPLYGHYIYPVIS